MIRLILSSLAKMSTKSTATVSIHRHAPDGHSRSAVSARLPFGEEAASPAGEVNVDASSASSKLHATYRTFITIGNELTAVSSATALCPLATCQVNHAKGTHR